MNPLYEVLYASDPQVDAQDIRAATRAALHALRHDRRLEVLDIHQAKDMAIQLFHTPDIRTLERRTEDLTGTELEATLANARTYVHQMLVEVLDVTSMQLVGLQQLERVLAARGGLMRVSEVPFRLHVYDRRLAMLPRDFDDNLAGAVAVREPSLLTSLTALHAQLWRRGRRWVVEGGSSTAKVDLMDVLAQLLYGATDESASAHLHISLRTYRRKVQDLLSLMGARTRFQAGAIAQERGYLDLVIRDDGMRTS